MIESSNSKAGMAMVTATNGKVLLRVRPRGFCAGVVRAVDIVELALEARYPKLFVPRYAMVTFHRLPYTLARSRGEIQDRMLTEICGSIQSVAEIDWSKADALVQRELTPLETA